MKKITVSILALALILGCAEKKVEITPRLTAHRNLFVIFSEKRFCSTKCICDPLSK